MAPHAAVVDGVALSSIARASRRSQLATLSRWQGDRRAALASLQLGQTRSASPITRPDFR
jgi:hypothetical protein